MLIDDCALLKEQPNAGGDELASRNTGRAEGNEEGGLEL